jgi:hypothetical protein
MADLDLAKRVQDILDNPGAYREQWCDEARRENPDLTDEQVDAAWQQVQHQFGL